MAVATKVQADTVRATGAETKKPENKKPEDPRPFHPDKANWPIQPLAKWLANWTIDQKIAFVVAYHLELMESELESAGIYDGDIGNDLYKTCEHDVLKAYNRGKLDAEATEAIDAVWTLDDLIE